MYYRLMTYNLINYIKTIPMDYHSCHVACYDLVQVDELKAKGETDAVIESTAEGFSTCRFFYGFSMGNNG